MSSSSHDVRPGNPALSQAHATDSYAGATERCTLNPTIMQ